MVHLHSARVSLGAHPGEGQSMAPNTPLNSGAGSATFLGRAGKSQGRWAVHRNPSQ